MRWVLALSLLLQLSQKTGALIDAMKFLFQGFALSQQIYYLTMLEKIITLGLVLLIVKVFRNVIA